MIVLPLRKQINLAGFEKPARFMLLLKALPAILN